MISYGGLSSRRRVYLNREMTVGINALHTARVTGDIDGERRDVLSPTAMSAVGETRIWSDICETLRVEFPGNEVEMFPMNLSAEPLYSSKPKGAWPKALAKDTQMRLSALKSVTFLSEPFANADESHQANATIRSLVAMLSFGLDGPWIVRISRPVGVSPFSCSDLEKLNHHAVSLERSAWTSTRILTGAIEAYASAFQQAQRPFALLDEALQNITWNRHFEVVSTTYFQSVGGALAPIGSQDAKKFRDAVTAVMDGRSNVEMVFHHDQHPCVAALHGAPLAHFRPSGKKLIGLELKGALPAPAADSKLLAGLFGLTQREADVVALLSSGKSVSAIAASHAVSIGTVRVQLKAIFRKMGVVGQVELVSKILDFRF
jgi:DNA-binding CsgD family transcriptional regulator